MPSPRSPISTSTPSTRCSTAPADRRAGRARGRLRAARARAHRPRRDERRGRALQGLQEARDQADHRRRGLLRGRPRGRGGALRAQPPDAAGRDDEGFRNLVKLSSAGFLEGYRRGKANVDLELLDALLRGRDRAHRLPRSRASAGGWWTTPRRGARPRRRPAAGLRRRTTSTSRSRSNGIAEQDKANEGIVRIAREVGRPLVGTADVHYLRPRGLRQPHGAAVRADQEHARRAEADLRHQRVLPQGHRRDGGGVRRSGRRRCATTLEIAERCDVEIELGKMLIPRFPTPEGEPRTAYLRGLAHEGLRRALRRPAAGRGGRAARDGARVIEKMGFAAYFLIVWDFVKFAKDNGIAVGPGRGSAAGSIVSYCLRITDVDPLEYDLLFERFLNAERDLDAGHRHRLLRARAATASSVRRRQVRPRVGRADRHLRPDVPARRHARRRARARATTTAPATGWRS